MLLRSHCPSRVSIFSNFPCLSVNIFVCKFVYIIRTDQNPFGSCQPFSILYIMMTACAAALLGDLCFHFKKENISDREWFIIAATEARHRLRHTQQKTAQPVQG